MHACVHDVLRTNYKEEHSQLGRSIFFNQSWAGPYSRCHWCRNRHEISLCILFSSQWVSDNKHRHDHGNTWNLVHIQNSSHNIKIFQKWGMWSLMYELPEFMEIDHFNTKLLLGQSFTFWSSAWVRIRFYHMSNTLTLYYDYKPTILHCYLWIWDSRKYLII